MTSAARDKRAIVYQRVRLASALLSLVLTLAFPLVLIVSGLAGYFAHTASATSTNSHTALLVFGGLCAAVGGAASLPLDFLTGWLVDRRFGVGSRSAGGWVVDRAKALLVGVVVAVPLLLVFSWALHTLGIWWWAPVAAAVAGVSLAVNRLGPVLLIRMFYRLRPLAEGSLRDRVVSLCQQIGFRPEGVFAFNLSRTTTRANAALAGVGGSRRVLLADTLLEAFSEEEIETVVAHELGHHRLRHIPLGMLEGAVATTAGLCAAALLHQATLSWAGAASITNLVGLPLVPFWLTALGALAGPAGNVLSRRRERQADAFAVRVTNNREAFASALRKLATKNLADPEPHPVVEILFHSHPSIARRLAVVEKT